VQVQPDGADDDPSDIRIKRYQQAHPAIKPVTGRNVYDLFATKEKMDE
jgi:hypothetical protein